MNYLFLIRIFQNEAIIWPANSKFKWGPTLNPVVKILDCCGFLVDLPSKSYGHFKTPLPFHVCAHTTVCYLNNYRDFVLCAAKLKKALNARTPKEIKTLIKQNILSKLHHQNWRFASFHGHVVKIVIFRFRMDTVLTWS